VLLFHSSKDQDVVQVDHHDTFCYEVLEDVVHHGLEGGGAIGHAKEHYQRFKQASIGPESCLSLISGLDADVVETPTSSLVKYLALRSCNISLEISGRRYLFLTVMELRAQ